jgi:hypothetical protein
MPRAARILVLGQIQPELNTARPSEARRRKRRRWAIEFLFARPETEQVGDLSRKQAFAAHARTKTWVIQTAPAQGFQSAENLFAS